MIDDERFHREIDGLLSPAESARLHEELRADPEAKVRYDDLRRLQSALASMPPAEPPPGLVQDVMRAVRARARALAPRPGIGHALRAAFTRRPALGLGLSFATGLLVAAGSIALLSPGSWRPVREADSVGTAMPPERLREIDRAPLRGPGLEGEAISLEADGQVVVRVRVLSASPLELSINWPGGGAEPLGFDRRGPAASVVLGREALLVLGGGVGTYEVRWDKGALLGAVRIRLRRGDDEAVADLDPHAPS